MPLNDLFASLFDDPAHPLAASVAAWAGSSRRFTAFLETYRSKLRKKLRGARDPEAVRDLALELETAYLLLSECSLELVYEPQPLGTRSPDFAVRYGRAEAMLEVTRLRDALKVEDERFGGKLAGKLGQVQAQSSNVLLIAQAGPVPSTDELRGAMLALQRRAEAGDPALVARFGFRDRGDFFRAYRWLSGVLVRGPRPGEAPTLWLNPQARAPLPEKLRAALLRSHSPPG